MVISNKKISDFYHFRILSSKGYVYFEKGKLRLFITPEYPRGLLTFNLKTKMDCQILKNATVGCFQSGDFRANEHLGLVSMHNLWARQHNNIVDQLHDLNPNWSPEQLYQEARKIVGAQLQIISFESWLPRIIGQKGMKILGKYNGYKKRADPTITNEFATAA